MKIKPCPFCGGEAHHRKANCFPPFDYVVACEACGGMIRIVGSKAAATRIWNRRYSSQGPTEQEVT